MRKAVGWCCWLGMVSISVGEIVAWKMPISRYSWDSDAKTRLEKPPETSVFFQPGDELWDAGRPADDPMPEVEWAVWNETSRTLVTKSGMETVWPLYEFFGMDDPIRQCLIRLEVFETSSNEPLKADAAPAAFLTWVAKSRTNSAVVREAGGKRIDATVEPEVGAYWDFIRLRLAGNFQVPGQQRMAVTSQLSLKPGVAMRIAEESDGERGMEIRATASPIGLDGGPLSDSVRLQKDGIAVPFGETRMEFEKQRVEGKAWLLLAPFPVGELTPEIEHDRETDPFAEPIPGEVRRSAKRKVSQLAKLNPVVVPSPIKDLVEGPLVDVSGILRPLGIRVADGKDFAGYDIATNTIVYFTESDQEADKLQALTANCYIQPSIVESSVEGRGYLRIATLAGTQAFVARETDDGKEIRKFLVEPSVSDDLVDLGIEFFDHPSPESSVSLKTSLLLENGKPLDVQADGVSKPFRITAVITKP